MSKLPSSDPNPPLWLERLLLLVLKKRDRETISGDLLEEYREVILPARGSWRANLWYLTQTLSLVDNVKLGVLLGLGLGTSNLISTAIAPLADDTPLRGGMIFGAVLIVWGLTGFSAQRRTGRFVESAKAGATVGAISIGLFHIAAILRLNLFLDSVSRRSDWQGLLGSFRQSSFESLRVYTNYIYLRELGFILFLGVLAGAMCGAVGGLVAGIGRRRTQRLRHA